MILGKGVLLTLLAAVSCAPIQGMNKAENDVGPITKELSPLSLQNIDPYDSKNEKDSFEWQNSKHYESVVTIFQGLADRELTYIIQQLIEMINGEQEFFDRTFEDVISHEQERIFGWMKEDVLVLENYQNEIFFQPNRKNSEDGEERQTPAFIAWQIAILEEMLSINIETMEAFTEESIHMEAIKRSLKEHTDDGGKKRYSWLLNETIEGSLSVSENFAYSFHKKMGIPEDLIANILGGLWFDYNWEEFELDEPRFLQKTYIKTLNDLLEGTRATDVKMSLIKRVRNLFTFNHFDFESPLKDIHKNYNEYNERKDWLAALIEWSVYSTYRKVFANPDKKSKIKSYPESSPILPIFQEFNREEHLLECLKNAYNRARGKYTKVYPHPDTKRIVFGSPSHSNRAVLDIQKALGQLKGVGKFLEPRRRKNENVFIPQLYFVVSSKPNQKFFSDGQQFFHVPLCFNGLPRRPLTRSSNDGIFEGISSEDYFKQVKADVVAGSVVQGKHKAKAEKEITDIINNKGLCNPRLIHSERGVMQALRKPENVEKVCDDFAHSLQSSCGSGLYTVHGVTILGYSTNTVCPCCTPTLITLQNPYIGGGFLNLLVQKLNAVQGEVTFKTTGYFAPTIKQVKDFLFLKEMCTSNGKLQSEVFEMLISFYCRTNTIGMDWTQFRLNTFITASIDFDEESRDLAETGQHSFGRNTNPPKGTHNPHAKLFFPSDEIDIAENTLVEKNTSDPYQRFFYEFVGLNIHTQPLQENPYFDQKENLKFPGVVFSSGSTPWGHGVMQ